VESWWNQVTCNNSLIDSKWTRGILKNLQLGMEWTGLKTKPQADLLALFLVEDSHQHLLLKIFYR